MLAALCSACGLAAILGVPASGGLFLGSGGMLLGIGAARALVPRKHPGLASKTALTFAAVGVMLVGSVLSVLDFSTLRGVLFWGLYLGLWFGAASKLAGPAQLRRGQTRT
jgi:hypothetical protein